MSADSKLRVHDITLVADKVSLRPMTEGDWDVVMTWNNDPEVLHYSEGGNVTGWRLDDLQRVFRAISEKAYIFLVEFQGQVVGECWLQEMNLDWVLAKFEAESLWRIDIALARESWGRGVGTTAVGLLSDFGFGQTVRADRIFAAILDYNLASQACFRKNSFHLFETRANPPGAKAESECHFMLTKEEHTLKSHQRAD